MTRREPLLPPVRPAVESSEGCRVRLAGDGWTMTEVIRTIGSLSGRVMIDLTESRDGEYLTMRGTPAAMLAVIEMLPVDPEDSERIRRRYLDLR